MNTGTTQHSVAYLGPRGSFAEAAVLAWPGSADAELLPSTSVPAALEAVRGDTVDHALVPIENSVEGSVSATLDELGSGQHHMLMKLCCGAVLLVRPGTTLDQISRVATHPHAQAQVRRWLAEHLPDIGHPRYVHRRGGRCAARGDPFDGAISQKIAADIYGLDVLADEIADTADAVPGSSSSVNQTVYRLPPERTRPR